MDSSRRAFQEARDWMPKGAESVPKGRQARHYQGEFSEYLEYAVRDKIDLSAREARTPPPRAAAAAAAAAEGLGNGCPEEEAEEEEKEEEEVEEEEEEREEKEEEEEEDQNFDKILSKF